MKTILAPVDFSSVTPSVAVQAVALARALKGRVVLLTVTELLVFKRDYAAPAPEKEVVFDHGAAAGRLLRLQARLQRDFSAVETRQLDGAPIVHILEQAKELGADYIVMGSHGHTSFYDLVVGSTTHGVLKSARCPVVIVPPPVSRRPGTGKTKAVAGG